MIYAVIHKPKDSDAAAPLQNEAPADELHQEQK